MNPYESVARFEEEVAAFAGARYGVATDSCTSALFLTMVYHNVEEVCLPARTYISVPMAAVHADARLIFEDRPWSGEYRIEPYPIWDSALRFRKGMHNGGFRCLSFQVRKQLPIGKAGMILTDDLSAALWLRKARSNGRTFGLSLEKDKIDSLGWNMSLTPEQASRGLQLLDAVRERDLPDLENDYPDLREMPVFKPYMAQHRLWHVVR